MLIMIRKMFRKILNNERGFTLIELMVVVVILGILASIVIPRFADKIPEAQAVKTQADIKIIQNAVDLYYLDEGEYPTDTSALVDEGYLHSNPFQVDGTSRYEIDDDGNVTID